MAQQTFDAFYRGLLKSDIPRVVYLHGPEDVLKDEAVNEIVSRAVDPSLRDFNVDVRSAASLDPEEAETLCHTLPMMADRRVVVIRDVEAWAKRARARSAIMRYLERPAPETVLVLVQGSTDAPPDRELGARATTVAAEPLPPERAARWLEREAARAGIELAPDAAAHLVRAADGSLSTLRTELAKLAGLAGEGPVGLELVQDLLGVRRGETQYDWRDFVLRGDTARALTVLPHVLSQSGVSGVSLVGLLGTALLGLGLARAHRDRGPRAGSLERAVRSSLFRARPARISYDAAARDWSELAAVWPLPRVEAAIRAALRADDRLKNTALSNEQAILTDLLLELGTAWRNAA